MKLGEYYFDPDTIKQRSTQVATLFSNLLNEEALKLNSDGTVQAKNSLKKNLADPGFTSYLLNLTFYKKFKGKMYVFNNEFLDELLRAELRSNLGNLIADKFSAYVAMPQGRFSHDGDPIIGVYMHTSDYINPDTNKKERMLITSLIYPEIKTGIIGYINFKVTDKGEFEDFVSRQQDQEGAKEYTDIKNALLLMAIYISSGAPDLREVRPEKELSSSGKRGLINKGIDPDEKYSSDIVNPVQLISWGWKKPPLYQKDYWAVRPYIQAILYGPGKTQRKAMLFFPSIRQRHGLEDTDDATDESGERSNPHFNFIFSNQGRY